MSADPSLASLRDLLSEGLHEQAVSLAKNRDTREVRDHALHLAWADALEELGLYEDLILELNLAIRDNPENLEPYPRLAEVMLDNGQARRAVRVWEALIKKKPSEPSYYEGLGEALREAKEFERARQAYEEGLKATGDSRFQGLIRDLGFLERSPVPTEARVPAEAIVPAQHQLVTFTTLFSGREGVYARQWVSPTGESGYTPVQEPLTLKVAENHILGNYTVGCYPVRMDNTVNFTAFDIDVAKFAIARAISSEKAWKSLMDKAHRAACKLTDIGAALEVPVYIEDSGFKGRHCWVFHDSPVPAGVARKFGSILRQQLYPLDSEITVEVFPKQSSVKGGGLGNLIKLPLGIHKRTGKRALFIEPDGRPYKDQLGLLETVVKARKSLIYSIIQRYHSQGVPGPADSPEPAQEAPGERPSWQRPEVVRQPYDIDSDPQFQYLMLKCPTLKSIVTKINQSAELSKDETQVVIHTIGHLDHGPEAVNELFRRCLNADPSLFLKSQLKGNPMSCPKIRARIPAVTSAVACNCMFDTSVNLYPTPLIYIRISERTNEAAPLGLTVDSLQFRNLLQEYLRLRQQLRETQILIGRYEERLKGFFEDAGVESVQTPTGKLSIIKKEGGEVSFSLDL